MRNALEIVAGLLGFIGIYAALAGLGVAIYFISVGLGALGLEWPTFSRDVELLIAGVIISIFAVAILSLWKG